MRRWLPLLFLLLPAATCSQWRSDADRFGLTEEELNAPPSYHRMKGAIYNDVRKWRRLKDILDEGRPGCPMVIERDGVPTCARDDTAFEVYTLSAELPDEPYREAETAFYCREESVYYYHYVGGRYRRNVWLGPYRLVRKRPKDEE